MLEPVRASFRTGERLQWTRVHDLPDFVYFNHSIHIAKGIGCESCHGRVDRMPLMRRAASLQMSWCLDCHEHPTGNVRPLDAIYKFGQAADSTTADGAPRNPSVLAEGLGIDAKPLLDCWTCHR